MFPNWRISHARGFLALGLIDDAAKEIASLPDSYREHEEVRILQVAILQEQQEWLLLQPMAAELVRAHPEDHEWWIMWAYSTRRAENLETANAILRDAEIRHPEVAIIQFNLSCYACQLGQLDEARARLKKAITLDHHFAAAALSDPDLSPLREAGWPP